MIRRGKRPKRQSEKGKLNAKLDSLIAPVIKTRDNWTCVRPGCGRSREQGWKMEAAHILPKKYLKVRFNEENIVCMCSKCHRTWHDESGGQAWIEELYPGRIAQLRIMEATAAKPDVKALIAYYETRQT